MRRVIPATALLAVLILIGCGGPPPPTPTRVPEAPRTVRYELPALATMGTVSGNGITITFTKTADWDAGNGSREFTAEITVLNETGGSITPWTLEFNFLTSISEAWNASYAADGQHYVVTPAAWNEALPDGTGRSFGFKGTYTGVFQEPTSYVLSGIAVGPQGPAQPVVTACTLDVDLTVTASWTNGNGTHGLVATVYMTNEGPHPITWSVGLQADLTVIDVWNATFREDDELGLVFTPASWNTRLEPGEKRSFGFTALHETELGELHPTACPTTAPATDPAIAGYQEALAALSDEERRAVQAGNLVWTGTHFLIPSQGAMRYVQPSHINPGTRQFQAQSQDGDERTFRCPTGP